MKVHKGDTVQIVVGKDAGKQGKVLRVYANDNKVLIEGLNLYKKHKKPKKQGEKGETINVSRPLPVSNVALFCSNCNKPVRAGYKMEGDPSTGSGQVKKIRICKKCQVTI